MISYNLTPFAGTSDDPAHLKQMAMVKTPLMTKSEGKAEQLRIHIQEIIRRMTNQMRYLMKTGPNIIHFPGKPLISG
jgi:hypothetical protein